MFSTASGDYCDGFGQGKKLSFVLSILGHILRAVDGRHWLIPRSVFLTRGSVTDSGPFVGFT